MASTPDMMTRIAITEPGGPEKLRPEEVPVPKPAADEVLVKIAAAGLNRGDIVQRQGFYPPPPGASDTPGLEVSGTVVATGANVTRWKEGDEVCALLAGGGYADYCTVHEAHCLPVPESVSLIDAAALPEVYFTVWTNVFQRGGLKAGETLLIHGGASGIGTAAIQLASALGARVFATAGSEEKCRVCQTLGAERAINYRDEDFVLVTNELTEGRGIDVIFDMVGGDYVQRNISAAARDGRIVNIAYQLGSKVELNLLPVMLKRLTLTGSTLRARSVAEKAALAEEVKTHVWPYIETGRIKPVVHATYPLFHAGDAHKLMESSAHVGKILLLPETE